MLFTSIATGPVIDLDTGFSSGNAKIPFALHSGHVISIVSPEVP